MSLDFSAPRRRRTTDLTPMIDVVFLLLIFFMLASRFGQDSALALSVAGKGAGYSGPPRLVGVSEAGLTLNGVPRSPEELIALLGTMTETPEDVIILRPSGEVELQAVVTVLETLTGAGFRRVVLLEAAR